MASIRNFFLALGVGLFLTYYNLPSMAGMIDESGLKPWENCALCHSLDGVSRMAKFPKLAAQEPAYIEKQILDFRSGKRTNDGGQMKAMAGLIADKDIPIVAAYFNSQKIPVGDTMPIGDARTMAERIVTKGIAERNLPACFSCHAKDNVGNSGAPRLEQQHAGYIAKQLEDFKEDRRQNDPAQVMSGVAKKLTKEEVMAISKYLASIIRR